MSSDSNVITRINQFQAAEDKADELHTFLTSLLPYISGSDGCISCEVLRNTEEKGTFAVIERWESKEAHQQSIAQFPQEEMQAAMPLFGGPPSGAYYSR